MDINNASRWYTEIDGRILPACILSHGAGMHAGACMSHRVKRGGVLCECDREETDGIYLTDTEAAAWESSTTVRVATTEEAKQWDMEDRDQGYGDDDYAGAAEAQNERWADQWSE